MYRIDASLFDERHLVTHAIWLKRTFAIALMGISYVGTYVLMNGNQWVLPTTKALWIAMLVAFLYQALCSYAQFSFRHEWLSLWYLGSLLISAIPSTISYGRLFVDDIAAMLNLSGELWSVILVWLMMFVIMVAVDLIPERIIVRRRASRSSSSRRVPQQQPPPQKSESGQSSQQQLSSMLQELLQQETK